MKNFVLSRTLGILSLSVLAVARLAQAQVVPTWSAFNDLYAGPETAPYATAWNVFGNLDGAPGNSGPLTNVVTGEELPVILTINYSGNVGMGTTSGQPDVGTPAYNLFHGYIDWTSGITDQNQATAPQIYSDTTIDYVFTGLNPEKRYGFVGTSVRGGISSNYSTRWTMIELVGARDFQPKHTTGEAVYTNNLSAVQVAINSGKNSATGDYADWESIQPSADGTFTIRCTQYTGDIPGGTASGNYGYALMAIRLQEFDTQQYAPIISQQPTNQTVVERDSVSFKVAATGNPTPSYQWYQNGAALSGATNKTLSFANVTPSLDGAQFQVVVSNQYTNQTHSVTSDVATLTVLLDKMAPALLQTIPTAGVRVDHLTSIELFFSKPITGVDASDLLINGNPAIQLSVVANDQYLFEFPQPPMGTVQVSWATNHGIKDLTVSANPFVATNWFYKFDTNADYESLRINEILAANKHVIRDEDGGYSDWIEMYNASYMAVPLAGCYLTDDPANLAKWKFPAVTMPSGTYLLVWASGKNRTNPAAPLHTDFQLAKSGGYLALVKPDGTNVIYDFAPGYPAQYTDVSYGSDRADPTLRGYFTIPTPGAPNSTTGAGFGPEVTFSRNSGTFTAPFTLALSTTSTNAVIHYDFGTNIPTASSPIYTGPIQVTNTVQIRARAFVTGLFPGDIQSGDYIQLNTSTPEVTSFSSSLPIIVFHNYGGGSVPVGENNGGYAQFALMQVFEPKNGRSSLTNIPDITVQSTIIVFHNYGGGSVPVGENNGGYAQFALMQVFEPKNGRSSLTNIPDITVQSTIHRRGQATLYNPKANLRLQTIDEYGGPKNLSLAGFPSDNDWVLYGIDTYDKVLMHNPMAHSFYRQMGHYSSRTRYVEVYLKDDRGTPGALTAADYNGLYVLEEKIKIGPDRVNIDKLEPENTNAPSVTGGYLFSVDKGAYDTYAGNSSLGLLDPNPTVINSPQRNYLNTYLDNFYSTLTGPNWTDPTNGYASYIDVPTWIDYHLAQVVVFNADMLRISSYYCKARNGKFNPAALWDFDRAFGMYSSDGDQRGFNPWRWRSGSGDGGTDPFNPAPTTVFFDNPWYGKMFTDPDFWQKYIDRYQELRQTTYSGSNFTAMIDGFANEINEATAREYTRWRGNGGSDTTPNAGEVTGDGWTYTFPSPGTWAGEVQFIKTWFTNRFTFMDTNFLDRPVLSRPGGLLNSGTTVTLTPAAEANSSVIYTLDGRDPRLPGGEIAPYALSKKGPISFAITGTTHVFARSWNPAHQNLTGENNPPISSSWSGVSQALYYTAVPALRVTEIMYHPGKQTADGTNSVAAFEYIELTNTGNETLNLVGFQISGGIHYQFTSNSAVTSLAAGGRVLVVSSLSAFNSRYPAVVSQVAGAYTGQLNNGGDRIVIIGPLGEPVQDFTFNNSWYSTTDGLGFSLVAVDANASAADWSSASQWRPSTFDGGTPGKSEIAPTAILPVVVNEVLPNPVLPECDAIELFNPNATAVDISYWYLTDDSKTPRKYLIPPGTSLPGYGYVVFYETNSFGSATEANALGLTNQTFGLNSDGEEVYLFSGDSQGHLTGYYDGFGFGPAASGVSFGRYTNSIGAIYYPAQSANTLGAPNAVPFVGPVVISEIMYDPHSWLADLVITDNSADEYVELHNYGPETVLLYDTNFPAITWHVRGGISFDFPTGASLPPNGYLLLVSFSPSTDPAATSAFLARHNNAANATLYGPYSGRLNNAGDQVVLRRPGSIKSDGQSASMVVVDQVTYGVASPWPDAAKGSGSSLQRINEAAFGDDPANWTALPPTPGTRNEAPRIIAQPKASTVGAGSNLSLFISATGGDSVNYQWFRNNQSLKGSINPSLQFNSIQLAQAGNYSASVQNDFGTATSESVPLVVVDLPASQTAKAGDIVTLRAVVATPLSPYVHTYQWLFNGTVIASGENTATATTSYFTNELVLSHVSASNSGDYLFVITNSVAPAATFTESLTVTSTNVVAVGLSIAIQTNNVVITWPNSSVNWRLEETTDLMPSANWNPSAVTPILVDDRWQTMMPLSAKTNKCFRLKSQ